MVARREVTVLKMDRLIGIVTLLLQNDKLTAPMLAERFEVSRRTILRDVDALCAAGVPVVTLRGGDGGIRVMEGYKIRNSVLNTEELQNLISALQGIDSISKTSASENLLLKLAPGQGGMESLASSVTIDLSSYYKDSLSEKIACLRNAIAMRRVVEFDYYYPKGECQRAIEPYLIEFRWNAWYVFGWCGDRHAFRRYKLNRLWALAVTEETFLPRQVKDEDRNEDPFAKTETTLLRVAKTARYRLVEEYGPECYRESEEGLYFTLAYTNREYALWWILGFGDSVEVLEPAQMRTEVAEMAKKMAAIYQT